MGPDRAFADFLNILILSAGMLGIMVLPLLVILSIGQVMRTLHRTRSRRAHH